MWYIGYKKLKAVFVLANFLIEYSEWILNYDIQNSKTNKHKM